MKDKKKVIKTVVGDISATRRKMLDASIVIMGVSVTAAIYTITELTDISPSDDGYEGWTQGRNMAITIAVLSIGFFVYAFSRWNRFKNSFLRFFFPIAWVYDNGNVFILNERGILNHLAEPPKEIVSSTFKGVTWELEDLKGIIEDVRKGELSFASFLPSVKIETSTNRIEPYIPFRGGDKLNIVFYDLDSVRMLLINLVQNAEKAKLTLSVPIPNDITFGEKELIKLVDYDLLDINCEAQFYYVDQAELDAMSQTVSEPAG